MMKFSQQSDSTVKQVCTKLLVARAVEFLSYKLIDKGLKKMLANAVCTGDVDPP